jgi:hypothetical protein
MLSAPRDERAGAGQRRLREVAGVPIILHRDDDVRERAERSPAHCGRVYGLPFRNPHRMLGLSTIDATDDAPDGHCDAVTRLAARGVIET